MELYTVVKVIKYKNGGLYEFSVIHIFDKAPDARQYAKKQQEYTEHEKHTTFEVVKTNATLNDLQGNLSDIKVILNKLSNL